MEGRQLFQEQAGERELPIVDGESRYRVSIAAPIISEGDVMGCVVFLNNDDSQPTGEVENKLAATVARFLGKQMES